MSYAKPEQVAVELCLSLSSVPGPTLAQWQGWINNVERRIAGEFKKRGLDLATQVGRDDPLEAAVVDVVVAAVARKRNNPEGLTSTTVTVHDGSLTKRRDGVANLGDDPLEPTGAEWSRLLPSGGRGKRPQAFSVSPS